MIQGAPDLALTQVAIESLTTVLFVLVLRRLPDRFESRVPLWRRSIRIAIAGVVGLTVFALALATGALAPADTRRPTRWSRCRLPDGGGRNVVNVILVDFRGYDTLGEITVLAAAAIGTVALARAGRRPGVPDAAEVEHGSPRCRRRCGSRGWSRSRCRCGLLFIDRDGRLAVPVVRRPQPCRAADSRAGSSPAPRSPCATSAAASPRCAGCRGASRGWCSVAAC